MSRYFFHLYDTIETRDEEGVALSNDNEAERHAIGEARTMIAAEVRRTGVVNLHHWIEVENQLGEIILIIKFADAIDIRRRT